MGKLGAGRRHATPRIGNGPPVYRGWGPRRADDRARRVTGSAGWVSGIPAPLGDGGRDRFGSFHRGWQPMAVNSARDPRGFGRDEMNPRPPDFEPRRGPGPLRAPARR